MLTRVVTWGVLVLALLPAGFWPGPAAAKELLDNGGFEAPAAGSSALTGWTVLEGKAGTTARTTHGGTTALEATHPGQGASVSVESRRIACRPGAPYVARVWFCTDDTATPWLYLQFFDGRGERIFTVFQAIPVSRAWATLSVAAVAPRKAHLVSLLLFSGAGDAGTFQADDASLVEHGAEGTGVTSLLPNPGFETAGDGGTVPAAWHNPVGSVSLTAGEARSGRQALRLTPPPAGEAPATIRSAYLAARAGQRWSAAGWGRRAKDAAGGITLEFWSAQLQALGAQEAPFPPGPGWVHASAEAIAPSGTTGVSVRLSAAPGAEGSITVDDLSLSALPADGVAVVGIGSRRQLFLVSILVDEIEDLETVFHPAVKEPEPVIVADQPWEKPAFLGVLGNSVFYDEQEKLYKMYYIIYQVLANNGERQHVAYAVSRDGRHWRKPRLGVADYKGSRANNLLNDFESPRYGKEFWSYNVIKDTRDPDPARRYKALGVVYRPPAPSGVLVAFSPDGFHWTEPPENPVLPNLDTHTVLGWDDAIGKYVAYPRTDWMVTRSVGYSVSDDFVHWTPARTVLEAGPGDPAHYQIYGMPVFRYEGLYLGLPWAFIAAGTEPLDTQLAVSRDGVQWRKVADGRMFVPRGPAGAFDDSYAICANPIIVGDELWFYYMGCGFPHGPQFAREPRMEGSIGLARLRRDGFVSLASTLGSGGSVTTRPVRFTGRRPSRLAEVHSRDAPSEPLPAGHRTAHPVMTSAPTYLVVNCRCPKGWLRAELQDGDGTPLPGFAEADCDLVRTDSVRRRVTWKGKGDVRAQAGKPVRVKIRVADGEVFSFGFE